MWRRRRRNSIAAQADALALECEALLRGRSIDVLVAQGRTAPAWTRVNALAHGSRADLMARAADEPTPEPGGVSNATAWRMLMSFLAYDLLTQVDAGETPLGELQRTRLIPLELHLLGGHEPEPQAGRLATMVMAAVRGPQPRPQR